MGWFVIVFLIFIWIAVFFLGIVVWAWVENNWFHKHTRETVYEKETKDWKYFWYSCSKCKKRKSAYFTPND